MKALGIVGLLFVTGAGCYREYGPGPMAPMGYIQPEPVAVGGPPGGAVDPGYAYDEPTAQDPDQPGYPAGYPQGYPADTEAGAPAGDAGGGGGEAMGNVTDAQIDATLAPYGDWVQSEEYGRVWRPSATVVGASFTPYETCGSWVWTDYGWTYNCDWDWGWLPFHYGQWDWLDGGWGWIPDNTWGPGWVDWRYGSGYVGWRPRPPRDHRGSRAYGQVVLDRHSRPRESDWRFIPEHSLGRRIRGNLVNTSSALAGTSVVARPPVRGARTVSAASLFNRRPGANRVTPYTPPVQNGRPAYRGQRDTFDNRTYPRGTQPRYDNRGAYQPPRDAYQPNRGAYQQPNRGVYQQPNRGAYQQPNRGAYQPRGNYNPPARGTSQPSRGTYSPPSRPSSGYSRPAPPSSSTSRPSPSTSRPSSSSSGSSRGSSSSSGSSRGSSGGSRGRR